MHLIDIYIYIHIVIWSSDLIVKSSEQYEVKSINQPSTMRSWFKTQLLLKNPGKASSSTIPSNLGYDIQYKWLLLDCCLLKCTYYSSVRTNKFSVCTVLLSSVYVLLSSVYALLSSLYVPWMRTIELYFQLLYSTITPWKWYLHVTYIK